jgi:hypothetical protein
MAKAERMQHIETTVGRITQLGGTSIQWRDQYSPRLGNSSAKCQLPLPDHLGVILVLTNKTTPDTQIVRRVHGDKSKQLGIAKSGTPVDLVILGEIRGSAVYDKIARSKPHRGDRLVK